MVRVEDNHARQACLAALSLKEQIKMPDHEISSIVYCMGIPAIWDSHRPRCRHSTSTARPCCRYTTVPLPLDLGVTMPLYLCH